MALGLAVTVACLAWAFYAMAADDHPRDVLRKIAAAFTEADYRTLPVIWAILAAFYWLKAWRWRLLLSPLGDFRATRDLLPAIMAGFAFNNLLPARIGEFVRVYVFARAHDLSKTAVLTSVALERVLDAITILALLGIGIAQLGEIAPGVRQTSVAAATGVAAVVACLLVYLIWTRPVLRAAAWAMHAVRIIPLRLQRKILGILEAGAAGMAALKSGHLLAGIVLISAVKWLLNAALVYCSLVAFDIHLPWAVSLVLLAVVAFGVAAPSSPGYFGVIQLCFLVVLELFLSDRERIFASSIYFHVAQYVPVTLIGLICFNRMGLKISEMREVATEGGEVPVAAAPN